jgi:hypothetical protein
MTMKSAAVLNGEVYNDWDGDQVMGCVCDEGFFGWNCEEILCPLGDDPGTTGTREVQVWSGAHRGDSTEQRICSLRVVAVLCLHALGVNGVTRSSPGAALTSGLPTDCAGGGSVWR